MCWNGAGAARRSSFPRPIWTSSSNAAIASWSSSAAASPRRSTRGRQQLSSWGGSWRGAAGLLLTFAAGVWNIGIEGQVIFGAVFATGLLRALEPGVPAWAGVVLAGLAAMLGGGMWGGLAGALRAYGNVNEIFGGLGLNFIAGSLTVYLVLGPWARPGIASTSGTLPFPDRLWLPTFAVPPLGIPGEALLGLIAIGLVAGALRGTQFGLRLNAIGKSSRAAYIRGIPVTRGLL